MPRETRRQEQTGPIDPQMQYIEEQQFISQETPERVAQASNEYRTIFGADAPTAFKPAESGVAQLQEIVIGSYRAVEAAGRTLETDVAIDRQNDATMAREIDNQIKIIDSDPNLTPEQKQLAKYELQQKGFQSALRPETMDYFKTAQKVTTNTVDFLNDADNYSNVLFEFRKQAIRMTPAERLEKLPGMYRLLEQKFPGFSDRTREAGREDELKAYELVWRENSQKSILYFDTALNEFFSAASLQDPNRLFSLSSDSVYNGAIGIMNESEEAKGFIPTIDDASLRDILVNRANTVLFERQGIARNNQRTARIATTAREINNATDGSVTAIDSALDFGGVDYISRMMTSPVIQGESGTAFGRNLQTYKNRLMEASPENPEFLMRFLDIAQYNRFNLSGDYPQEFSHIKEAIDLHKGLRESERQPTNEELALLKSAAGQILDSEVDYAVLALGGEENAAGTFGYTARLSYGTDHGPRDSEMKYLRQKDITERTINNVKDTEGAEAYTKMTTASDLWVPTSNALQEGVMSAIGELSSFNQTFPYLASPPQSTTDGGSTGPFAEDINTLVAAHNQLEMLERMKGVQLRQPNINNEKNAIVESIWGVLDKYNLKIATPRLNASPDMDELGEANTTARGATTQDPFMYLAPYAISAWGNLEGDELANLTQQFDVYDNNLRAGLEKFKQYIPDQLEVGLIDALDQYREEVLENPESTAEDIIRGGLGLLDYFEKDFQKAPDGASLEQQSAWGILQGNLRENKQNLINALASSNNQTNEFIIGSGSDGDGNSWLIKPRPGSSRQFGRMLEGRILPLAERGYVNLGEQNASVGYLVESIDLIGNDFRTAMEGEENPANKMAAGLAAIARNSEHMDILRQVQEIHMDPARRHLLPTPLVDAMRNNFMVPLLGEGNRRVLDSLIDQRNTSPEYAVTVDLLDTALPVILNVAEPARAAQMGRVLNIATSRLNQAGTYRYSHTDIEVSNTDLLFAGLEEAIPQHRAGIVDLEGRSSFLTGVTSSQANAISLTGLPFDSSPEAVGALGEARHISEALLGAMFDAMPEVRQPQAVYEWTNTIWNESMRSFMDPEANLPVAGSEERALTAKGRLLGLTMPSNATMSLSIVPSGNINTESSLKWNPATPDKPGFYSIEKNGEAVEITTANELVVALEKDFSSGNPAFKIEAQYVTSPNDISPPAEGVRPTLRFVPQRDMGSKVATGMPAGQRRRIGSLSQVTVAPTASGAAIKSFITSDLSGFRQLNAHLGVEEGIHPELQPGFEALLGSFDTSVGNNSNINGTVDQNLRQWPEKVTVDGTKNGKEIFLSTQDYGRSVADQEALLQGLGILHFQIRETLEQNPDMTPEELTKTVNKQMIELSQMLDTSKGISTWETTDDIMFERPSGDGTTTQIDQYEIDIEFMDMMRGASYSNHNRDFLSSYSLAPGQDYNAWANTWTGTRSNYRQDKKLYRTDRRLLPKSIRDTMITGLKEDFSRAGGKQMRLEYYWRRPLTPLQSYQNMGSR